MTRLLLLCDMLLTFDKQLRYISRGPNCFDARSIANAYYYGVSYARPGLLRMCRSTARALERLVSHFCSRKAVQSRIYKIAVRYDRQKNPILSVKINRNPSDPWVFQLMVYKCDR